MPETNFFGLHFNSYSCPVLNFQKVIRMNEPFPLFFSLSEKYFSVFINFCLRCSLLCSDSLLLPQYEVIYYQLESNFQNYNVQVSPALGMS